MIKRPVKYDPFDKSISDGNHVVICHPFQKLGLPDREFNKVGQEIADCINAFPAEEGVVTANFTQTPAETNPPAVPIDYEAVVEEKRKPGRPKGKR